MRPIVDRLEREYLSAKARPASEVDRVKALIKEAQGDKSGYISGYTASSDE